MNIDEYRLLGRSYTFPDGNSITVLQIKLRDENIPYVTYMVQNGPGIPQKLIVPVFEFLENFGHLFNISPEDKID